MANVFSNNQVIYDKFLARFQNKTQFALTANRNFTEQYEGKPMRKGDTLYYRLPYNFTVGHTLTVTPQSITDQTRPITVNKLSNIALTFNGTEIKLEDAMKDPFEEQYMLAQVDNIANDVEATIGLDFANSIYNNVGTPGAGITASSIGDVRAAMGKYGILFGELFGAVNMDDSNTLTNSLNNSFNTKVNTAALTEGYLGGLKGFNFFESVFLQRHISGVGAGGAVTAGRKSGGLINGAVTSGTTVNIDGVTASVVAFKKGDRFTVAGVYSVNPLSKVSTGKLQDFVVTADATSNGSGQVAVVVSPAIVISGAYQNVTAQLADNAAVTMLDDHNVNIFYNKEALYYAAPQMAPLRINSHGRVAYDKKYRMALTFNSGSSILTYEEIDRVDHLWGEAFNPEFAFVLVS
jgi:hypothetical protein